MVRLKTELLQYIVYVSVLAHTFVAGVTAASSSFLDSAESNYTVAAREYNKELLEKTVELIDLQPTTELRTPKSLLLKGLVYWRLELIAYCSDRYNDVDRYGKLSIGSLDEAQRAGADVYITSIYKALVYQLMASKGIKNGAMYGPRAADELTKAKSVKPQGYLTRLVEAINTNQTPVFAGGSPKKAVVLFEALAEVFPDSIDVKIHLTDAYIQTGRLSDAQKIIAPIVTQNPNNLLARKIAGKLEKKK